MPLLGVLMIPKLGVVICSLHECEGQEDFMAMLYSELPGTVGGAVVVAWVVWAGEGSRVRQIFFTAVS